MSVVILASSNVGRQGGPQPTSAWHSLRRGNHVGVSQSVATFSTVLWPLLSLFLALFASGDLTFGLPRKSISCLYNVGRFRQSDVKAGAQIMVPKCFYYVTPPWALELYWGVNGSDCPYTSLNLVYFIVIMIEWLDLLPLRPLTMQIDPLPDCRHL